MTVEKTKETGKKLRILNKMGRRAKKVPHLEMAKKYRKLKDKVFWVGGKGQEGKDGKNGHLKNMLHVRFGRFQCQLPSI